MRPAASTIDTMPVWSGIAVVGRRDQDRRRLHDCRHVVVLRSVLERSPACQAESGLPDLSLGLNVES